MADLALHPLFDQVAARDSSGIEATVCDVPATMQVGAIGRFSVVDATGRVVDPSADTLAAGARVVKMTDCHFKFNASRASGRMHIGTALVSRVTCRWTVPDNLALQHDGRFAGVAKLADVLARQQADDNGVIAQFHSDGAVAWPAAARSTGCWALGCQALARL